MREICTSGSVGAWADPGYPTVDVIVVAHVVVIALVNGNGIVVVIVTVDDQRSPRLVSLATIRSSNSVRRVRDARSAH
jgi:hypothetical protein